MSSGFSYTSSIDLSTTERESDILKMQVDELQKRMDLMKATFDREKQRLESEIEVRKLDEKQQQNNFEESLFQLQSQVADQKSETRSKMKETVKLTTELDVFLSKVSERTNGNIESLDDVISLIDQLKEKARADARKLRDIDEKNFALTQEKETLEQHLKEKCIDIKDLKSHWQQSSQERDEEFAQACQTMQAKMKKQEKLLSKMAGIIETLKSENDRLKVKEGEVTELEAKLEEQKMDVTVQVLEAKKAVLEAKLDEATETIEIQTQQIAELNETVTASADEIREQMNLIDDLRTENKEKTDLIEALHARNKQRTTEVHKLRKAVKALETEKVALQTEVSELKLALQERKVEEMPCVEREVVKVVSENPAIGDTMSAMEESLHAQAEEIKILHDQRNELLNALKNASRVLQTCENFELSLEQRISQLSCDLSERDRKLEETAVASENRERQIFNNFIRMLPMDVQREAYELTDDSLDEKLRETVKILLCRIEEPRKIECDISKSSGCDGVLLQHLYSACRLVRKLAGGLGDGIDKDEILKDCARIGRYVDEHQEQLKEYAELTSLFDIQNDSVDVVTQTFLGMITDESVLYSSPFRELYVLFCCLVHVNKRLATELTEHSSTCQVLRTKVFVGDEIETQLSELELWKEEHERQEDAIYKLFASRVDSPPEKLETLAQRICELLVEKDAQIQECQKFIEQQKIEHKRDREIRRLKKRVSNQDKEREQFCDEVEGVTNDIRDGVIEMQEAHQVEVEHFENEVEELKEMNASVIQHYKEKIEQIRVELEEQKQENQELLDQIHTLKKEVNALFAKCASQEDELVEARDQISSLGEQLNRAIEHKNHYKRKCQDAERRDSELLTQLQSRSLELKTKYEAVVADITNQLEQAKEELAKAQNEIDQFDTVKQDLLREKARLTISERTLSVKLAALQQQMENGRSANISRETALQNKLESKMANQRIEFETEQRVYRDVLSRCSELLFGQPLPQKVTFANLNTYFTENLEARAKRADVVAAQDANDARRILGAASLASGVSELLVRSHELDSEVCRLRLENERASELITSLQYQLKRKQEIAGEGVQWNSWAKSIVIQLSNGAKIAESAEKLRTQVEDLLINSMSQRTCLRKLEILRREKFVLTTQSELLKRPARSRPLTSIRPVIVALALGIRLKKNH